MSLNRILLLGNLGKDPEIRYLPSGKQAAELRIATNRRYKVEGQVREETEWFHVVAFGRLAEICGEFLKKGKMVFVEGRIRTRNWIDASGQKHYKTEVIAEGLRMIGKGNSHGSNPEAQSADQDSEPF